jgi:adenylate cyclase
MVSTVLGSVYAFSGDKVRAEKVLTELLEARQRHYVCSYEIAVVCLGLGEKNRAEEFLQRAYEEHSDCMIWPKGDPRLDILRSDPLFQNLLKRINLLPS